MRPAAISRRSTGSTASSQSSSSTSPTASNPMVPARHVLHLSQHEHRLPESEAMLLGHPLGGIVRRDDARAGTRNSPRHGVG